ncbi:MULTISPECIES: hypothetical protein [unclassified Crossiella]|uniref:hypothetical protein n=1 Tax=unclassified Crossiella TaxID=2620835 RepID=UPI001FFE950B|nr:MULTISPECIES: hypothetical protein [unclassified Crossiella]MCK2242103.1 hypothetical protein [Crossiella sp. S99.2]MCK2256006.1 hypothetical protein [Crossiella sp. S99.1]
MTAAAPVHAWGYLTLRRWRRRVLLTKERPGALIAVVLGLLVSVTLQITVLGATTGAALPSSLVDIVGMCAPFLLPVVALTATFRTPLRLDVADVSWLMTAPGGRRVLLARHLFGYPVLLALLAGGGAAVSRALMSQPVLPAWKLAFVVGVAVLTVRLIGLMAHLAARRATWITRGVVLVFAGALALTIGEPVLRGELVVQRWLLTLVEPAAVGAQWVVVPMAGVALLAAVVIWRARGYVEAADERARQNAELQVAMRRDTSGLETGSNWFQTGLRSWSGDARLTGERALLFRGAAQQRRMMPTFGLELGVELLITVALLVFAPGVAWLPVAFVLLITVVTSSFTGIAVELDHHHLWVAPLRPLPALLCVTAVPAAAAAIGAELPWLALLVGGAIGGGTWLTGALLIPMVITTVLTAGALAVSLGGRGVLRVPLSFGFTAIGLAPAGVLLFSRTPVTVLAVAITLLGVTIAGAVLTARTLWSAEGAV